MNPKTKDTAIKWARFYCIIFLLPLTLLLCHIGKWEALPYCYCLTCTIAGILFCAYGVLSAPLNVINESRGAFYSHEQLEERLHIVDGIRIVAIPVTIMTILIFPALWYAARHEELLVKCICAIIPLLQLWRYAWFFRARNKLRRFLRPTYASKNFPKTFQ